MAPTLERSRQAIELTSGSTQETEVDFPEARRSDSKPELSAEDSERILKNNEQIGSGTSQRTALLGILLAELGSIPFEEVASLVAVKPDRLLKLMHGEEQLKTKFEERGLALVEMVRNLHQVLEVGATSRWLNTPIPDLAGKTPLEAIERGSLQHVVRLTKSYLDQSFA